MHPPSVTLRWSFPSLYPQADPLPQNKPLNVTIWGCQGGWAGRKKGFVRVKHRVHPPVWPGAAPASTWHTFSTSFVYLWVCGFSRLPRVKEPASALFPLSRLREPPSWALSSLFLVLSSVTPINSEYQRSMDHNLWSIRSFSVLGACRNSHKRVYI